MAVVDEYIEEIQAHVERGSDTQTVGGGGREMCVFEVADLGNVCKVVRAALCSCVLHSPSRSRDPPVLLSASCVHHELF